MAEYISREAVLELARKGVLVSNGNYESVCGAIREIPAADVVERFDLWSLEQCLDLFGFVIDEMQKPQGYSRLNQFDDPHDLARYLSCFIPAIKAAIPRRQNEDTQRTERRDRTWRKP